MSDNNLNGQEAAGQSGLPEVPEIVNPYESDTLPPTYTYPSSQVYPPYPLPRPSRKRFGGLFQRLTLGLLLTVTGLMSFLFITAVGSSHASATAVASTTSSTGASVLTGQTLASSTTAGATLTVQQVSQKVRAAVVQITSQQNVSAASSSRLGGSTQTGTTQDTGVGSGIIYDQTGYILTNNHVVEGADSLLVSLTDGRTFQGTVVGTDPVTDLAVVKIDPAGTTLPVAVLGNSDALQVGDGVVAIGNALALEGGPTLTTGVVSALNRSVAEPATQSATGNFGSSNNTASTSGTQLYNLIQTDAAINPGNSGGPLVNMQGQIIGINTLAAGQVETGIQAEGIGFAISINGAKTIAQQIVATGKVNHAMLGITSQPLTSATATSLKLSVTQGTVVVQVQSGSAAAQAGLKQGDVITAIDNQRLTGESTLGQIINGHQPGDTVQLSVITPQANGGSGQVRVVAVTLGQRTGN